MRRGDFEAAWRISDEVLRSRVGQPCWHWPRHEQYVWDGSPLKGKRVLVRCYHGLGDTIQFIRYMPLLRRVARHVTVWVQPVLIPLLSTTVQGVDQWLPLHEGTPEAAYDVDVEIMELPHVFRTTLQTLPSDVPYLHVAPAADVPPLVTCTTAPLRIGLVWRSGEWDSRRSLPSSAWADLAGLPQIQWYSLQRGPGRNEWTDDHGLDLSSDDPLRLAQVLRALDLFVTVDSFPAHLAGALGVPTMLLLPHEADWRWMEKQAERSPWYPSLRLIRQDEPGDWASANTQLRSLLLQAVAETCAVSR